MATDASARRAHPEPNRLHRRTERLERVVTCLLGLLTAAAAVAAFMAGAAAYTPVAERAHAETADRTEVTAVLLDDAVPATRGSATRSLPVRWTDRLGTDRTATVPVQGFRRAGDRVPLWTADDDGRAVPAPTTLVDATVAGILTGALALVVTGGVVYLTGKGVYAWTGRRYGRAWAREWERVGPQWTPQEPT